MRASAVARRSALRGCRLRHPREYRTCCGRCRRGRRLGHLHRRHGGRRSGFAGELSDLADGIDWMTPCCRGCRLRRRIGRRVGGGYRLRGCCGHFLRRNDAKGREAKNHQSCDYVDD